MTTETELLATLRDVFSDLAQKLSRLVDAQDAAGRASCWSPPQRGDSRDVSRVPIHHRNTPRQAAPKPLVDDQDRARRREAADVPARLR